MKLLVCSRAFLTPRIVPSRFASPRSAPPILLAEPTRRAGRFTRGWPAGVLAAACLLWTSHAVAQVAPDPADVVVVNNDEGEGGLVEGDRVAASGDWATARVIYEETTQRSADDVAAWYRVGVARAIGGDAAGAAEAFRRVRQLAPELPDIDGIIAAAEERAAFDESQALEPSAVFSDEEARSNARRDALAARLWLHGVRYELVGAPGESPAADAISFALEGNAVAAAEAASQAAAQDHEDPTSYLVAAQRWLLAGDLERARYFLSLYETFEGDPSVAAPLFEELRAPL